MIFFINVQRTPAVQSKPRTSHMSKVFDRSLFDEMLSRNNTCGMFEKDPQGSRDRRQFWRQKDQYRQIRRRPSAFGNGLKPLLLRYKYSIAALEEAINPFSSWGQPGRHN